MRKITSLTLVISFLVVVIDSVALYIAPSGRVANWADWRFWGLTKTQWSNQHIIVGLLFLLAIFLHIYYNWKPIVAYLKNKARQIKIFTREFNIAMLLVVIFTVGAYVEVVPFRWVLTFSDSIKSSVAREYGEPPYRRAELSSLATFTSKMDMDLTASLARLRDAGIRVENEQQTLLDIARQNNTFPQQIYKKMKPKDNSETQKILPEEP